MALRAVSPDEKAPPSRKTVAEAAKLGQRDLLVSMRDRIAEAVSDPKCPPRDLAALTKRLQDIARDIAVLDAQADNPGSSESVDDSFDASAI